MTRQTEVYETRAIYINCRLERDIVMKNSLKYNFYCPIVKRQNFKHKKL